MNSKGTAWSQVPTPHPIIAHEPISPSKRLIAIKAPKLVNSSSWEFCQPHTITMTAENSSTNKNVPNEMWLWSLPFSFLAYSFLKCCGRISSIRMTFSDNKDDSFFSREFSLFYFRTFSLWEASEQFVWNLYKIAYRRDQQHTQNKRDKQKMYTTHTTNVRYFISPKIHFVFKPFS